MTAAPMLPGRRDAPTMATDRGRSTCSTAATAAVRSRSSKRRRPSSVSVCREGDLELAGSRADLDREPGVAERLNHLVVAGQHHGGELADALGGRRLRELGEQDGGDPASPPAVGDGERDLRALRAVRDVLAVADHQPARPR